MLEASSPSQDEGRRAAAQGSSHISSKWVGQGALTFMVELVPPLSGQHLCG